MPGRFRIAEIAVLFSFVWLAASNSQAATTIEECAQSAMPVSCLDSMLKQINLRLNTALRLAQERVERLQREGRRSVQNSFVNSQRQFNAYRDANCAWQAIAVAPASSGAFIKECQIRLSHAREQELLAFAQGNDSILAPAPTLSEDAGSTETIDTALAATEKHSDVNAGNRPPESTGQADETMRRGTEWRLLSWVIDGIQRELVPESKITIAFDPSGKIAGNASVNSFSGRYRFRDDGGLEWPSAGFALTKMAGPPPLMRQERAFIETLRRMLHYQVDGENLTLESASRRTVLTFAR